MSSQIRSAQALFFQGSSGSSRDTKVCSRACGRKRRLARTRDHSAYQIHVDGLSALLTFEPNREAPFQRAGCAFYVKVDGVAKSIDTVEKLSLHGLIRSEGHQKYLCDRQRSRTALLIAPFFRAAPSAIKRRTFQQYRSFVPQEKRSVSAAARAPKKISL
jgi:hypothetical protein